MLGIALVIIVGLNAAGVTKKSWSHEVAWGAAALLCASCILSYLALRHPRLERRFERWADGCFLGGICTLFLAVIVLALHMA
ncbi:hypothetical protein [Sphingomonas sp. 28-63-12]|uniref:hypothetical protein n=1 Tax=Sphingomonas sp. 28-63-12 TaxID=1970434 RepID=UPI000BDB8DC0|nr:MAG: hypothetical protein B7Y47_03015 [Sphingomonas sp. 28-63-12]